MTTVRIDDCLSKRDGHLWIKERDAVELVREFGSPVFVLSEDQSRRNARRFQAGWPDGPVKVLPAAKANWLLAVQRIIVPGHLRSTGATPVPRERETDRVIAAD